MRVIEGHGLDGVLLQEPCQGRLPPSPNRAVSTIPLSSRVGAPIQMPDEAASSWTMRS